MLQLLFQPSLEGSFNDSFGLEEDCFPLILLERAGPRLGTVVLSHFFIGFLLSPLDIARTR